ncbi:(d)CMP kinase [Eubacterium ruminantium]|jgi:cytidylate kinase|uniref:Cytidylate kinase n=2 Tax=Eubacterium TaxID=1730 RepID=A0A1T4LXQ4_9FIRM|nr:(d)CMP kinase [Eubacterium ruminantium]SCW38653.1 cytidylate kinase [Eubacterium ruminantium]SDM43930.1 cytidylate kinase [Eubacterium ruminantium]SJZ59421.1 cytidylate kinase [Eubacterium ruminantium]
MNIAIDGPAGAGKSTIARLAAKKLGFLYVDTGAMYRAIALYLLWNETDIDDEEELKKALERININIVYENNVQHVFLNFQDVSAEIRSEKVSIMASKTSALQPVRDKLLNLQKDIATKNNVIMDGRDIGTNILPNAEVKIYLDASVEVRAKRRFDEMKNKGENPDLESIKLNIIARDEQDMNRKIAPLKKAEDATLIDSSYMSIDQVVDKIISLEREANKDK